MGRNIGELEIHGGRRGGNKDILELLEGLIILKLKVIARGLL